MVTKYLTDVPPARPRLRADASLGLAPTSVVSRGYGRARAAVANGPVAAGQGTFIATPRPSSLMDRPPG